MKQIFILCASLIIFLYACSFFGGAMRTDSHIQENRFAEDTVKLEKSFWDMPMDGSIWDSIARDSIKYIWANDTTDFGLSFPIDHYEMCTKRYNKKPQPNISLDMIVGTWYGYGRLYEPMSILTLNTNGEYTLFEKSVIKVSEDYKVQYDNAQFVSSGQFSYKEEKNELTFKDCYSEKDLIRGDYIKYENPHDKISIVFSLEQDTLTLYEDTGDCYSYYRNMF